MGVRKTGSWRRIPIALSQIPSLKDKAEEFAEIAADYTKVRLQEYILGQEGNWAPLTEEYAKRRAKEGGDSRVLVRSGTFVRGVRIQKRKYPNKTSYFIGWLDADNYSPPYNRFSGLTMADIALILEYGTDTMPARPFIRPVWEQMRAYLERRFVSEIREELSKIWR